MKARYRRLAGASALATAAIVQFAPMTATSSAAAAPVSVPALCAATDDTTQTILNALAGTLGQQPPVKLPTTFLVTSDVPANLDANAAGVAHFSMTSQSPQALLDLVKATTPTVVTDISAAQITATGAGTMPPVDATGTITIQTADGSANTIGPFNGNVTAGASAGQINYLLGPVTVKVTSGAIVLNVLCTATGDNIVGATGVAGATVTTPAPTTTTTTKATTTTTAVTTTTVPAAEPVQAVVVFTG